MSCRCGNSDVPTEIHGMLRINQDRLNQVLGLLNGQALVVDPPPIVLRQPSVKIRCVECGGGAPSCSRCGGREIGYDMSTLFMLQQQLKALENQAFELKKRKAIIGEQIKRQIHGNTFIDCNNINEKYFTDSLDVYQNKILGNLQKFQTEIMSELQKLKSFC